jgi:hypothetical protein
MVHYKEIDIVIELHEGKFAGAVVVNDSSDFVGKCPKAEDVGNQMVVNDVNEMKTGFCVGAVIRFDVRDKAGHDWVWDYSRDMDAQNSWSCTP